MKSWVGTCVGKHHRVNYHDWQNPDFEFDMGWYMSDFFHITQQKGNHSISISYFFKQCEHEQRDIWRFPGGTPKSSILIGFSIVYNHFEGPSSMETPIDQPLNANHHHGWRAVQCAHHWGWHFSFLSQPQRPLTQRGKTPMDGSKETNLWRQHKTTLSTQDIKIYQVQFFVCLSLVSCLLYIYSY